MRRDAHGDARDVIEIIVDVDVKRYRECRVFSSVSVSLATVRAWDCVAPARRGLPFGRKIYLLTYSPRPGSSWQLS